MVYFLNSIEENSSIGYMLKFDLEYPGELQRMHNNYPLVPKKLKLIMICCQTILQQ